MGTRIDIRRLKAELRLAAEMCRVARITYQDAQRPPLAGKITASKASLIRGTWSDHMTKLCIFRSNLRGVKHITRTEKKIDEQTIIQEMEQRFALVE